MNPLRQKNFEGIQAYLNALRSANESVQLGEPGSIESVRRISQSLQKSLSFLKDSNIAQALTDLSKATDEEIGFHLNALLPRLADLTAQATAETSVILLVGEDLETVQLLQQELTSNNRDI